MDPSKNALVKRITAIRTAQIRRLSGQPDQESLFPGTIAAAALALLMAWAPGVRSLDAAPQQAAPSFAVASIKPEVSGQPGPRYQFFPGFKAENTTLKDLLMLAYDVKDFQISGGPSWIGSDHYDIEATTEAKPSFDQKWLASQKQRLQTLMRERFGLTLHRETKELPIYRLIVAKGGLKLQPLKEGACVTFDPNNPTPPPGKTAQDYCGSGGFPRRGRYDATSARMMDLALAFSILTGRTVVDKTGITGEFPVHLTFAPDDSMLQVPGAPGDPGNAAAAADSGPSFFTAVQEQLGLRLESGKGPVEVLVIDHVEKPSEN